MLITNFSFSENHVIILIIYILKYLFNRNLFQIILLQANTFFFGQKQKQYSFIQMIDYIKYKYR